MLQYTVRKLVKLIDEIADIDTAHWVSLGERHRLGEVLPRKVSYVTPRIAELTLPAARALQ
jgi:hypothetical protein